MVPLALRLILLSAVSRLYVTSTVPIYGGL
jgi:hypothetical protein